MDELFTLILTHIGRSVFPVALFMLFSHPTVPIIPTPTPTVITSPSPSVTPTNTLMPTPTLTQTPHPTEFKPTNTPTPIPTVTPRPTQTLRVTPTNIPITSGQLDEWFTKYSNLYSIDRQKLWKVSVCESNLRAHATNGDYGGMYQFSTNTWISTRTTMNMDPNPTLRFNPEEAIKTAAFTISTVGLSPWPNCGK